MSERSKMNASAIESHNELMNLSIIKYQCPRGLICPDCFRPTPMCEHLLAVDLLCLFHPPQTKGKPHV